MKQQAECVQPNRPEVIARVVDGEAILIRLSNGAYYSLQEVGGLIWSLIEEETPLAAIARAVVDRYDVDEPRALADVRRIAEELANEQLVVPVDTPSPVAEPGIAAMERLPYREPVLEVYADMGDLLALDPPIPGMEEIPWKD